MKYALFIAAALSAVGGSLTTPKALNPQPQLISPSGLQFTATVDAGELPFGLDLSGVGLVSVNSIYGGASCTGSLITSSHVLLAAHCADRNSDGVIDMTSASVTFVDGTGASFVRSASAGVLHPSWTGDVLDGADLLIVMLDTPAPAHLARYAINAQPVALGTQFVKAGYGVYSTLGDNYGEFDRRLRAGRNRFDASATAFFSYPLPNQLVYDFDDGTLDHNSVGDLGFGVDEVISAPGDSGAPAFGADGSILAITSWATGGQAYTKDSDDVTNGSFGEVAVDLMVRDYLPWVRLAVSAFGHGQIRTNLPAVPLSSQVPEPAVAQTVLGSLGLLVIARGFRRPRQR